MLLVLIENKHIINIIKQKIVCLKMHENFHEVDDASNGFV